ncbi:MAG: PD40 domain-containing protein [Ignavibacteriae bacterium]|nr:PD40 domain-containing protein [Ignavibacteriota bacterium]
MKKRIYLILALAFFSILIQSTLFAQFGKNKVQYKYFKWQYIQTKHFDIYFSQDGYDIAEYTATVAESSLVSLSRNHNYNISNRIPLVVFNSHNEFQQNNVIDEYLPEGVGGVTELFKNRVLVPFEGDYEQFRHVIHHELNHAFMNDMYYGGSIQNIISKNMTLSFPLWFSEGMSEIQSLDGLDKATDMYIRNLIINDYLPGIDYCNGFLAYRGGQSFFAYLIDTYGRYKIGELMNNIKSLNDVDAGFQETYKLSIEKLSEKWIKELKKTYWPELKTRDDVTDFAKELTNHEKDGGFYNISPVISPDGSKFAFISNRDDLFDVFLADTKNGEIIDKLIQGNTSSNFEELQVLTPGLSWSPDGRKIAISVKAGEKDAIFLVDVKSGDKQKITTKFNSITYVNWSPDKSKLAFVGSDSKQSDIYIYNLNTNSIETLTNDVFSDYTPSWTPDGRYIYFSSDRGKYTSPELIPSDFKMSNYKSTNRDIYKIEVATKTVTRITDVPDSKLGYAQFSSDGKKMLYVSDESGITNIYLREEDSSGMPVIRPITNSLAPLDQISLSKDGKKLLFTGLNKGGYDIYSMDNPFDKKLSITKIEPTKFVMDKTEREANRKDSSSLVKKDSTIMTDTNIITKENADSLNTALKKQKDSLNLYGSDIRINFNSYNNDTNLTRYNSDSIYASNEKFKVSDFQNSDGSFNIKNYKIKFSPDLVYGNVNYSSFYGVQGVAQIALSDMLGDHRVYILTSMVIDLKNSDYALAYYHLPKRIDYGFMMFHTARFLLYNSGNGFGNELYRFRTWGGNISASYPFSKFKRVDGSLAVMNISRENLDDVNMPIDRSVFIVPSLSLVHDNTLYGMFAPVKGTRYNLTLMNSPKLGTEGLDFTTLMGDIRTYGKLGEGFSVALRLSGGVSFGAQPMRFYLGGTENWINWEYESDNIEIGRNIREYAFSVPGLPLRGYNFDRISGSRYALANFEFRFPLFRYLILGALPIGFQDILGTFFIDAGTAWSDNKSLKLFEKNINGNTVSRDLLMGTGFGTRIALFGLPFKYDMAWSYDLNKFSMPKHYFSLALDF